MNILPQSTLQIVRQLSDPTDVGTNYVRAVVRNSATNATLGTVNLTDEGSQRFTGTFQTPPDASGRGYYVDITTTVYTDSGYTTTNTDYSIETYTYHVFEEARHFGGGGAEVNYDKVRRIVQEELGKVPQPEMPTIRDLTPELLSMERRLQTSITDATSGIKIPEQVKPDLDSVVAQLRGAIDDALNTTLLAIDNKDVTPETDLSPIVAEVQNLPVQEMLDAIQLLNERLQTLQEVVNTQQDVTALKSAAEEFMSKVSPRTLKVPKENPIDATQMRARKLLSV